MMSKCCRAEIYYASSIYTHIFDDWYECSQCGLPCATVISHYYKDSKENERF